MLKGDGVANQTEGEMFDVIAGPDQDPMRPDGSNKDAVKSGGDGKKPKPGLTAEQIGAMQEQLLEVSKQTRDVLQGVLRPQVNVQAQMEPEPIIDMAGLPDPVVNRAAYEAEVSKRLVKSLTEERRKGREYADSRLSQALSTRDVVDGAWDDLRERYPDLAKHKKIVEVAANEVANRYRSNNIDPVQKLAADTSSYVDEIAETIGEYMGGLVPAEEEQGDGQAEEGRDQILGARSVGARGGKKPKEQPGNFVKELSALQRELKIY